jgi:hypothetical protein
MRRPSPIAARRNAPVRLVAAIVALAAAVAACQPVSFGALPSIAGSLGSASPSAAASPDGVPPSVRASDPAASESPASGPAAALAVLDGLEAFDADPERTYRVSFSGDSRHTTDILKVKGTLDVSGDDAAIGATFRFPGQGSGRTDYRLVNGTDWVRFDKGSWRSLKSPEPQVVLDPFAGFHDGSRVQYLVPVKGKGDQFQVELNATYLHPVLIPAVNLSAEKLTKAKVLLVTDAAGIPIRGTWTMRGQGRVSGQLQAIAIDLDLTFSKIGEPLTIRKP